MSDLRYTVHSAVRLPQRGLTTMDVDLATKIGTEVEGGILVREKDFQAFERELKYQLDQARRLVGKRIVINGDTVITGYHANPGKQRRLLRHALEAELRR